jgi:Zn-dependent M28 family amino/carboxypeptidase
MKYINKMISGRLYLAGIVLALFALSMTLSGCLAFANAPDFNGDQAFDCLKKQCDFGPRPEGYPSHEKTQDYLFGELSKYSNSVSLQKFTHEFEGKTYHAANIIAHFGPTDKPSVMLCAHWDTRPFADQDSEPANRVKPILGADDGASGVAVLVELAAMFHNKTPQVPVTIVLLDGEDFGKTEDQMYLGARYFAAHMNKSDYKYGILLDMIGDKGVTIFKEKNSADADPNLVNRIWQTARDLGYGKSFRDEVKYRMGDDHVPMIEAGLPCVDLIDFDYVYWHTLQDTVDKCSPESLKIVGQTVAEVVYSEKP